MKSFSWNIPAALIIVSCSAMVGSAQNTPAVQSPDHRLELRFAVVRDADSASGAGRLVYSLFFNGKPLLENSGMSLAIAGGPPLGEHVRIEGVTPGSGVDDYNEIAGKTSHVHDAWNGVTVKVAEPGDHGRSMEIEARAYDGAVAFRYMLPGGPDQRGFRLHDENTEFNFDNDATVWALELPNFRSPFESEYLRMHVSSLRSDGGEESRTLVGLPLLTWSPSVGWLAITEANLHGNAVMYLTNDREPQRPGPGRFRVESILAPRFTDIPSNPTIAVTGSLPYLSAWRVFQVAEQPATLLDSNIIDDLNSPTTLQDTSWIHAGKTAWDWWSGSIGADGKPSFSTATMKYYVDFAAQSGFPYMLIDAGWSSRDDILHMNGTVDLPEVVKYAASKGVKVWIWANFAPTHVQMDQAFPLFEKWGVAGIKIDFVQRSDQPAIDFYYKAAQLAAEHHLMLDFHGTTTPWGLSRTWPNVLGFEGIMGMEYSKVTDRDDPVHRTTFSFTRLLNGPMDYTPGGFDNATAAQFIPRNIRPMVQGTRAQQLAMYVIAYAPFQMVSDAPQAYANQPGFQFIRDVPAAWDETRGLDGFPGESITVARRSGHDWYLGSITNWTARDISVPLDFLGSGTWTAQIYADASDADQVPKHVSIETKTVSQRDTLKLHLAPGGGCAIRFAPNK